jgi:hypothetical protein
MIFLIGEKLLYKFVRKIKHNIEFWENLQFSRLNYVGKNGQKWWS